MKGLDIITKKVFVSMGFDIESPCLLKGQSGLEYLFDGLAYKKEANHIVLISNIIGYGDYTKREFLLQTMDVGEELKKSGYNLSIVAYYADPQIYTNKSFSKYRNDEDLAGDLLKAREYLMNQYKINDYIEATSEFINIRPELIAPEGIYSFSNDGTSSFRASLSNYLEEKKETARFIENYGGFTFSIDNFTPVQVSKICRAKSKEEYNIIKKYSSENGIYKYFHPPKDEFIIGVVKNNDINTINEVNRFIEKSHAIGHNLSTPTIIDNNELDIKSIVEELIKSNRIEKKIKYGLTENGKKYYDLEIYSKPQEGFFRKLTNSFANSVSLSGILDIIDRISK